MVETLQEDVRVALRLFEDGLTRMKIIERELQNYSQQFRATSAVTGDPIETTTSRDLLSQIINAEDTQHMNFDSNDEMH